MYIMGKVLNFLLPARCIVTGDIVESTEMISAEAWAQLDFLSAPFCAKCGVPFQVLDNDVEDALICTYCLDTPPFYDKARAALRYDDGSRGLVLAYKHGDKTHMAIPFSLWMANAGQELLDGADLIVPVPLHWKRLITRRYNQAALLAQCLSRKTKIPVDTTSFKRTKSTRPQGHMNMKERCKNVGSAFSVPDVNKNIFEGKNIVLVDDVFTTGATANECAKVLLASGARSVNVLSVARTVYI
ncbi:MAG: ComF family protein [Alphaproteobacteria bacterium]|nr:ComF family protein [Alphaproteobacteria bacterium]